MRHSNLSYKNIFIFLASFLLSSQAFAQFDIGADVVSRYVWRGSDYGNSISVQPALTYATELGGGSLEMGAWGSFPMRSDTSIGANENDLYISYSSGPVTVVVTDYFFPGYTGDDAFFKYGKDGGHVLEAGVGISAGAFSLTGYYNFAGADPDNSMYFELGITPSYEVEGIELGLFVGAGNYVYVVKDNFAVCNMGLSVSKDSYSASYIVNPDQKTSFLVFGISL
jgi:hypothetical protein